MLQHDVTSPNVYSRIHKVSGTKASALKYPLPPKIAIGSVANRSNSIDVPDFTGGSWKTNKPVDILLEEGGNTKVIRAAPPRARKVQPAIEGVQN
jgi:hypothetical protein